MLKIWVFYEKRGIYGQIDGESSATAILAGQTWHRRAVPERFER